MNIFIHENFPIYGTLNRSKVIIRLKNTKLDGGLYDTDMVQTVSHVLPTGGPRFNYTHQQLKFTNYSSTYIIRNPQGKQRILIFTPSMEGADVNRPQQFVLFIN